MLGPVSKEHWSVLGNKEALHDVVLDFIDGADISLDALNARRTKVLVRAKEIVIEFPSGSGEQWIVEAFTRRHPDVTVKVSRVIGAGNELRLVSIWGHGKLMSSDSSEMR